MCQQKANREEQKENRTKWLTKGLKMIYLQKTETLKNEESPASDEAGEREAKSDQYHTPSTISGPCPPSCTIQRDVFLINYLVNPSFLVALETVLRRRESWDYPGGPVIKNSPCNAGDVGSTLDQGTKIPHAVEQLNSSATTHGPMRHNKDPARPKK